MGSPEEFTASPEVEHLRLADGSEVVASLALATMDHLSVLVTDFQFLAAYDLRGLADGLQPHITPTGDLRPVYAYRGLGLLRPDGSFEMHAAVADVVRNAIHINPDNILEFRLTDPTLPFEGFSPQA